MSRRKQRFPIHLTGDKCESSHLTKIVANENSPTLHPVTSAARLNPQTMDVQEESLVQPPTTTNEAESRDVEDTKYYVDKPAHSPRFVSPCPMDKSEVTSSQEAGSPRSSSPVVFEEVSYSCRNGTDNGDPMYNSDEDSSLQVEKDLKLKCPVCQKKLECLMSFNAHVYDHYQESTMSGKLKRGGEDGQSNSAKRQRTGGDLPAKIKVSRDCQSDPETYLPLDLSCHSMGMHTDDHCADSSFKVRLPPKSPRSGVDNGAKISTDEENLLNEAREQEKSFFNSNSDIYLTEDSSGFDTSSVLPVYQEGGATRQVTVRGDEGSPIVYKIKLHSEQMLVSRILGVNQETGNKIELYKCFLCNCCFPSISRLQAHLLYHKQKFVCKMCNYSCDTRAVFAHHIQRQHLVKCENRSTQVDHSEDSGCSENAVTVAALLSALREKNVDPCGRLDGAAHTSYGELEDERKSESASPISPSSESQESLETRDLAGEACKGYSCRYCSKRFDRAFSCNRHERVHTGFKPCYCRFCGRGFSEPRNLRHHIIRFHSDGSLRHLIKRDRRRRMGEEYCGASVSPNPLLQTGMQVSPGDAEVANFVNSLESLNANMITAFDKTHDHKPLNIDENSDFRQTTIANYTKNLSKMIATSLDSKPKHRKCDGPLRNGDSYRSHQGENNNELEPGEIRFKIGTKVIDDGERGRRLVMSEDPSDEIMEHSPQFSSYAPRLHIVQDRINRDKALTPITDDIGRTFYECPYCRKLFGSTSDLNRHLDFHEDLRPYDCDYCNYSARTNSQLKVHKMRHEGIKQYTCDVCNYNGVTQSDLNRHKKTQSHTARSQNICAVCGLGFYSHSQKQVHIVQCHPEMEGASSLIQMSLGVPLICKEPINTSDPSQTSLLSITN